MNTEISKKTIMQKIPWWLYLVLAIVSYCTLNYVLPSFGTAEATMAKLLGLAPKAAPIITVVFLILAANALYRDDPVKPPKEETTADEEESSP